ncbi:hypothetical protein AAFP35_12815 [Gordonia sp. CPCC 206044]|uniref:hypothetical protein n=1 Tax=Gordonia sp. CPCC 206044 TaxID=3140793 RepID=UPI003AF341AA
MSDPNSAIPPEATPSLWRRVDEYRAEQHLKFNAKNAGRLPGWRNRRGYRTLVVAQLVALTIGLIGAVMSFFTNWFFVLFFASVIATGVCMYLLRIVTGSIADTPPAALDEIQLAQRNSARSIGFFVCYTLMFIPYAILIVLSMRDQVSGSAVYGTAIVMIVLMVFAAQVPTMLVTWWMSDPDPEDYVTDHNERSE